MKRPACWSRASLIAFFCLGLVTPALAANNIYMSVTGARGPIQGDTKSPHGSQWIRIAEFDESVVSPRDPQSGLATGKRQHQPVKIVKQVDLASPQLQKAAATGEHLKEVVFQFYRDNAGKEELYETIRLSDAFVSSVQKRGGAGGHGQPTEEISFAYEKIEVTYTAQQKQSPMAKPAPSVVKPAPPQPR